MVFLDRLDTLIESLIKLAKTGNDFEKRKMRVQS